MISLRDCVAASALASTTVVGCGARGPANTRAAPVVSRHDCGAEARLPRQRPKAKRKTRPT